MNGTTGVNSVNQYLRIRKMTVVSSGSGQTNAGQLTASLNSNIQSIAIAGSGVSETLAYCSPRGKVAILKKFELVALKPGSGTPQLIFNNYVSPFGTNTRVRNIRITMDMGIATVYSEEVKYAEVLPEKSDVFSFVTTDVNNVDVFVFVVFLEIDPTLM
jgi:hypothetical protein